MAYSAISWTNALIGFILIPVATRLFPPAELGKINLLISCASIAYVICLLGFDQGFLRFYYDFPDDRKRRSLFSYCLKISLSAFAVLGVALCLASNWLSIAICGNPDVFTTIALLLVVLAQIALRFSQSLWRARENILLFAVSSLLMAGITKFCYMFAGFVSYTYDAALFSLSACSVLSFVVVLCLVSRTLSLRKTLLDGVSVKELWAYAIPLAPSAVLSLANSYIPMYAVRAGFSFGDVGVFSMAVTLSAVVSVFATGVNSFWPSYVFKNYRTRQKTIQRFHQLFVLALSSVVLAVIAIEDVVLQLLGPEYLAASCYFPFMLMGPYAYAVGETAGMGLHISKRSRYFALIYLAALASNVALCIALPPLLGMRGAALASSLSAVVALSLKAYLGEREYRSVSSMRYMVVSLLVIFSVSVANASLDLGSLQRFFVAAAGFVAILVLYGPEGLRDSVALLGQGCRSMVRKG